MCLNVKYIDVASNSHYYHPSFSNVTHVKVPCGTCPECIDSFRNDYFIRFRSEYCDCISKGGKVVFLTWTYDDNSVPAVSYHIENDDIVFNRIHVNSSKYDDFTSYIFCFDKSNLQRFFNSLRKFYERLGFVNALRYAVVGEYGTDTKYTQRPHFHGLLFLSKELVSYYTNNSGRFRDLQFMRHIRCYWPYGTVSPSKEHGLFVNNDDSLRYVSKYISKNTLLANLKRFSAFRNFIHSHFDELNPQDFKYTKSVDSLFLYYLRKAGSSLFVVKSKGLGLSALNPLKHSLSIGDFDKFLKDFQQGYSYISDGKTKYLPYSFYYYRKLFYYTREDGSYYLNHTGYRYLSEIFLDKLSSRILFINKLDFSSFDCFASDGFISYHELHNFRTLDLYKYVIYEEFIRNRSFPFEEIPKIKRLLSGPYTLHDVVYYFMRANYGYVFDSDISSLAYYKDESFSEYSSKHLFDSLVIDEFELFSKCLDSVVSKSREIKRKHDDEVYQLTKMFNDFCNNISYNNF